MQFLHIDRADFDAMVCDKLRDLYSKESLSQMGPAMMRMAVRKATCMVEQKLLWDSMCDKLVINEKACYRATWNGVVHAAIQMEA